ncbi:pentaheme c-type cytochrome TorC [Magnetospira thiophila]
MQKHERKVNLWRWLWRPSRLAAATLLIFGGLLGVFATGGFVWFVEYSNTEEFCIGCHEMGPVYEEFKSSVHAANGSGVGAVCSDCHVPKAWGPKMVRKISATSELYHKIMGTIGTPEKFEEKRLSMAENVWRKMQATDSSECRNCHSWDRMLSDKQREKARHRHAQAKARGETCVGCHKGIAHKRPDVEPAIAAARAALNQTAGQAMAQAKTLYPVRTIELYGDAAGAATLGSVLAAAPLEVLEQTPDALRVRVAGWQEMGKSTVVFADKGRRLYRLGLRKSAQSHLKVEPARAVGNWTPVTLEGWVRRDNLVADPQAIWTFAERLYELQCGQCHMAYPADWFAVDQWPDLLKAMKPMVELEKEDHRLIQVYLQSHAPLENQTADATPVKP